MSPHALSTRQIALRVIIILFCVWHMCAVAIFTIPRAAQDAIAVASRQFVLPWVTPYLYTTSQWQLWDIFAPDPLRVISLYQIERNQDDQWTVVETIKPDAYPFWQHATHFKYFINVLNADDSLMAAKERFLQTECQRLHLPADTPVQLVAYSAELPFFLSPASPSFWSTWTPTWSRSTLTHTLCPAPLS